MTKEDVQNHGLELALIYPFIIYEWSTGVGKSLMAIKIIEEFKGNWNIVLAETNHELNWINEFKQHNKEHLLKNVKFFCYQSLHKHLDGENYVFDECHHLSSDLRLNHLSKIKLKRFIGLSATLTRKQKEWIRAFIGNYHIDKISLSTAIDEHILPEPMVYFIGVELDNTVKYCKFYYKKDTFSLCTELEMYNKFTSRIEYLKLRYFATLAQFDKIRWLKTANDRKKFLSNCKTKHAKELLTKLEDKRLICFTGSIEQSKELSNGLSIHSKISKKQREELLEDFNSGKIDKLFATGMLKEGQNLNNIQVGIIVQLDNTERYFVQIHGRTLRSLYPEQYVLYVKDTQDETYVKTAIENFNKDYVKFI